MNVQMGPTLSAGYTPGERERVGVREKMRKEEREQ